MRNQLDDKGAADERVNAEGLGWKETRKNLKGTALASAPSGRGLKQFDERDPTEEAGLPPKPHGATAHAPISGAAVYTFVGAVQGDFLLQSLWLIRISKKVHLP